MKSLYEQFGGTYCKQGDYLIPNLALPKSKENDIGIYGQRHLKFLQEHRRLTYINLLITGKLNEYLYEIDKQAYESFFRIVEQMKRMQGITEQLKENNPLEWTRKMNCIRQQADESVFTKIIYQ